MNDIEEDDIMREIRATRAAFAEAHSYDQKAMGDTLRRMQAESGVPTVSFPPRPVKWVAVPQRPILESESPSDAENADRVSTSQPH